MDFPKYEQIKRCIELLKSEIRELETCFDKRMEPQKAYVASKRVFLAAAQLDEMIRPADAPKGPRCED
jgi:hypothetical protein